MRNEHVTDQELRAALHAHARTIQQVNVTERVHSGLALRRQRRPFTARRLTLAMTALTMVFITALWRFSSMEPAAKPIHETRSATSSVSPTTSASFIRITPPRLPQLRKAHKRFGDGAIWRAQFSPDGRWIALSSARITDVYDAATLAPVHRLASGVLPGPAFSPDGRHIAVFNASAYHIDLYDLERRQPTLAIATGSIPAYALSNSRLIYNQDGQVHLVAMDTGEKVSVPLSYTPARFELNRQSDRLIIEGRDGAVHLYLISSGTLSDVIQVWPPARQFRPDGGIAGFLPDGRTLVIAQNNHVLFVDAIDGRPIKSWDVTRPIASLDVSQDGKRLIATHESPDGHPSQQTVFRLATGDPMTPTVLEWGDAYHPNGTVRLIPDIGGAQLVDAEKPTAVLHAITGYSQLSTVIGTSNDSARVIANGAVLSLNLVTGSVITTGATADRPQYVTSSPDTRVIAWVPFSATNAISGTQPGTLSPELRDAESAGYLRTLQACRLSPSPTQRLQPHYFAAHLFFANPSRLICIDNEFARIIDVARDTSIVNITIQGVEAVAAASNDGAIVAIQTRAGMIDVFDVVSGARLRQVDLRRHGSVGALAVDAGGRHLYVTTATGAILAIDTNSSAEIGRNNTGTTTTADSRIRLSPDGRRLVAFGSNQLGSDHAFRLLDTTDGLNDLAYFYGTPFLYQVVDVMFTPDSNNIVSTSLDGTLGIWDAR